MKVERIKKNLKDKALKLSIILGVEAVLLIFAIFYSNSSSEELGRVTQTLNSINSEIQQKESTFIDGEAKLEEYLKISEKKLPSSEDYSIGYNRVKKVSKDINDLKQIYKLDKLTVEIGEITPFSGFTGSTIDVHQNTLKVEIEAITDEIVHSFFKDFDNLLNGYTKINNIDMLKFNSGSDSPAEKSNSSVKANLELVWIASKKKVNEEESQNNNAAPNNVVP